MVIIMIKRADVGRGRIGPGLVGKGEIGVGGPERVGAWTCRKGTDGVSTDGFTAFA